MTVRNSLNKVLVTGGHGFLGRHLAQLLRSEAIEVIGLGHGTWRSASEQSQWVDHWFEGDVSQSNLDQVMSNIGEVDAIFHLAGGASVGRSILDPIDDFQRSACSTIELLDWVRRSMPSASLVFASSAAVYGAGYTGAISEADNLSPFSPYGVHKRICEELFESYARSFGLRVALVRMFSVYGPELRKQLLWDVCCQLKSDSSVLHLGGTGEELRDWIFLTDAAYILRNAACLASSPPFLVNAGTGIPVSVRTVVDLVCKNLGVRPTISFSGLGRAGDPFSLIADTTRMSDYSMACHVGLEEGILKYVKWFKSI